MTWPQPGSGQPRIQMFSSDSKAQVLTIRSLNVNKNHLGNKSSWDPYMNLHDSKYPGDWDPRRSMAHSWRSTVPGRTAFPSPVLRQASQKVLGFSSPGHHQSSFTETPRHLSVEPCVCISGIRWFMKWVPDQDWDTPGFWMPLLHLFAVFVILFPG